MMVLPLFMVDNSAPRADRLTAHAYYSVHISDETYQLLLKQALRLQTTPEAVLEQLARELDVPPDEAYADEPALDEAEATIEALAAVKRLTNLFTDVTIPNFEQLVNDSAFALENVNILDVPQ